MMEDLLARKLTGKPLSLAAHAVRNPRLAALAVDVLRRQLGVHALAELVRADDALELELSPSPGRAPRTLEGALDVPTPAAWVTSADGLTTRYREGSLTPHAIVERILREADTLARRQPYLRCLWMRDDARALRDAEAATRRYAEQRPLGPLDGVPFVVKEHIGVEGFPCRAGHDLPGDEPLRADSTPVARLREAGAILIGQTAMTELGLSPVGINPKRPALRNPHHIEHYAGGSSTGSAIAAALGLAPLAVGTDGGGSVRIPAALCGLFGLKPTFGRVSRRGSKLAGSVTHIGPIASSVIDLAYFLDITAGADVQGHRAADVAQPASPFAHSVRRRVRGLTLGVDEHELRDTQPAIARALEESIRTFETCGVRIEQVRLPLAREAFAIGSVTIMAETSAAESHAFRKHGAAYGSDMQLFMHLVAELPARDYLHAQLLRARMRKEMSRLFQQVDGLVLPTTRSTALPANETEERHGVVDAEGVRAMCRHTFLANLTGHPAGTVPIAADADGLPIGMQLVGDVWDDGTVLALMAELERLGVARAVRPPHHVEILTDTHRRQAR